MKQQQLFNPRDFHGKYTMRIQEKQKPDREHVIEKFNKAISKYMNEKQEGVKNG